jgi:two-component system, LytTR family, sensor kinase
MHSMKNHCEGCGLAFPPDGIAYICSYECTYCPDCRSKLQDICSHCGGELVRRPRRTASPTTAEPAETTRTKKQFSPAIVWGLNLGVWTFIVLAYTLSVYELYRATDMPMSWMSVLGLQSWHVAAFALMTPFVFAWADRNPLRRERWIRTSLLLFAGGLVFVLVHVVVRGISPYAYWNPHTHQWSSAVWNYQTHNLQLHWDMFLDLFLSNAVDDAIFVYLPILVLAYAASYYREFRARELRTAQLQAQLEKTRLQALKSQLQPHFLFNTLNSISALMLTNVEAADRMITRLGDLLRISLETANTQMTTLSRELEFVNCYIAIEKVRFEERLKVTIDVSPETLDASLPHLLLQPLVDNAIKHGIARLASGGEIRISASRDDADLHLEVRDNGPGLREPALREPGHTSSGGVGLRITRERLETIYGQNQSMELLSLPEGGVAIRVSIPWRMTLPEDHQLQTAEASLAPT